MMNKDIFVSHYHKDADEISNLKKIIGKKNQYEPRDSSVYEDKNPNNAKNEEYIKTLIKPKIKWASTLIVIISDKTHLSKWVNWEIEYAQRLGKNIVGVYLPGFKEEDVPENLINYSNSVVGWNSEQINRAINGESIFCDEFKKKLSPHIVRELCN